MILSAHQPAYLPWLGYFHKIAVSDVFVIVDDVQFEKDSFINRNYIKTPKGPICLTVPVSTKGHLEGSIMDTEISNEKPWARKHWKSILHSYAKAPYFKKYCDFFENLYMKEWKMLVDLLDFMLDFFLKEVGIKTPIVKKSSLGVCGYKQEMVLNLSEHFKADIFLFGRLGKDYASEGLFAANGVKAVFQEYKHPVYKQLGDGFTPNISIIDLLLNVGPDRSLEIIMKDNISKETLKSNIGANDK